MDRQFDRKLYERNVYSWIDRKKDRQLYRKKCVSLETPGPTKRRKDRYKEKKTDRTQEKKDRYKKI